MTGLPIIFLGTTVIDTVIVLKSPIVFGGKQSAKCIHHSIGGNAFNAYKACSSLLSSSSSCKVITKVGCDADGDEIEAALHGSGSVVIRAADKLRRTVTSTIIVDGDQRTCISSPHSERVESLTVGEVHALEPAFLEALVASDCRHIEATIFAADSGATLMIDLEHRQSAASDRPLIGEVIRRARYAKVDRAYLEEFYDNEMDSFARVGENLEWFVVTDGERGCILQLIKPKRRFEFGVLPLGASTVVDSTGAGDAFLAAMAACVSKGIDEIRTIKLATLAAGITCQTMGGFADIGSLCNNNNAKEREIDVVEIV